MKRFQLSLFVAAAISAAGGGCGDNSKVCGPGTDDEDGDGLCEAQPVMCSNGTILDSNTNSCVIDPNSCQAGTVLINNRCVDPTEGLVVDLAEAAEPNNGGLFGVEPSADIAGEIELKAPGQTFVVKGNINPFRDADGNGEVDPDMDAYVLAVNQPTLVDITVDGVNGLMGAYIAVAVNQNPAGTWRRFGMNITGDTSKRQIFLPAAGAYAISVGDTRTLFVDNDSPPGAGFGGASGSPQANYFMSLTVLPLPAPTTLTVTGGVAQLDGQLGVGEVKFFTAPMGLGLNAAQLDIPGTPSASIVVLKNGAFKSEAIESFDFFGDPIPAAVTAAGFKTGDTSLIVADTQFHYGPESTPFLLTVVQGDAGQLSTTGGSVTQPESATDFSAFFYDIANANETTGINLVWNQPVSGVIVDENLFIAANFTFDPSFGFTNLTFDEYVGLVRHRAPGRYYILAFDPLEIGPTEITASTSIAAQTVTAITKGTVLANQTAAVTYNANGFTYDAGAGAADAWQVFNATGTNTGDITNTFFPLNEAFGRLGALNIVGGDDLLVNDVDPTFAQTYLAAGSPRGRIMIDNGVSNFFVVTSTAVTTGTPTFSLDFKNRAFHDFGTLTAGMTATATNQTIDAANPVRYFLAKATGGTKITLTADPVTATLDSQIQVFNANELVVRAANNGIAGADDLAEFIQLPQGWSAFAVSSPAAVAGTLTFNATISSATFTAPTYTRAAATIAFDNACTGGVTQTFVVDGSDNGPPNDEGFVATAIPSPAGWRYFGLLEPALIVASNGWLTVGTPTTAIFTNPDMPNGAAPNGVIAPFWDDLANVTVCTKLVGQRLQIQWGGVRFNTAQQVLAQVILDGTNNNIEFSYGPTHAATGGTATVGIEDQVGASANKAGFNTANTTPAGSAIRFTQN